MKKLRKVIKKLGIIVLVLVVVLTLLLTFSIHWMLKTWANLSGRTGISFTGCRWKEQMKVW